MDASTDHRIPRLGIGCLAPAKWNNGVCFLKTGPFWTRWGSLCPSRCFWQQIPQWLCYLKLLKVEDQNICQDKGFPACSCIDFILSWETEERALLEWENVCFTKKKEHSSSSYCALKFMLLLLLQQLGLHILFSLIKTTFSLSCTLMQQTFIKHTSMNIYDSSTSTPLSLTNFLNIHKPPLLFWFVIHMVAAICSFPHNAPRTANPFLSVLQYRSSTTQQDLMITLRFSWNNVMGRKIHM